MAVRGWISYPLPIPLKKGEMMSRMEELVFNFPFDATTLSLSQPISHNGYITDMIAKCPSFTSGAGYAISIRDNPNPASSLTPEEWWNSGALLDNSTSRFPSADMGAAQADIPCSMNWKMVVTLNEAAGAGGGSIQIRCCIKTSRG